ncbi:hypothetical protein [Sphingomonas koreensis]
MSEGVWISTAMGQASNLRPFRHSLSENERNADYVSWHGVNVWGTPLGAECFPAEIYGISSARPSAYNLPHLWHGYGYWVVSSAAAAVLRQFDLGDGNLYPVQVFQKDRVTPVGQDWSCINFGNRKSAILPGESPRMREGYVREGGVKGWKPPFVTGNDDIAVSAVALDGPDIWVDLDVGDAFFVSDRLANALKKAKVDKGFFLSRCRVT